MEKKLDTAEKAKIVSNIEKELGKLKNKEFSFMFFVVDTEGSPNGELSYIYEIALTLKRQGYNVKMLHNQKEFVGVKDWMGDEYANLPHFNVEKDGVAISPSDFLIIPEIYSSVMYQTFVNKMPCKRIALLRNFGYLTEMIQPGVMWADYGINECIVATEKLEKNIKEVFNGIKTHLLLPCVKDKFFNDRKAKNMVINIVAKNKSDVNRVVKEFFWRYPSYKWVAFRDLRGISQDKLSEALDESFATIWIDESTDFGCTALEAMASNNLVIGKIPENAPEWLMGEEEFLKDNGVWFYQISEIYGIIANIIQSFLHDEIPSFFTKNMKKTLEFYREDVFGKHVIDLFSTLVENREKELKTILSLAKK